MTKLLVFNDLRFFRDELEPFIFESNGQWFFTSESISDAIKNRRIGGGIRVETTHAKSYSVNTFKINNMLYDAVFSATQDKYGIWVLE